MQAGSLQQEEILPEILSFVKIFEINKTIPHFSSKKQLIKTTLP
jgi:hypothetical protein